MNTRIQDAVNEIEGLLRGFGHVLDDSDCAQMAKIVERHMLGENDAEHVMQILDGMPLASALWWFIENVESEAPCRSEVFFYLRERMREDNP